MYNPRLMKIVRDRFKIYHKEMVTAFEANAIVGIYKFDSTIQTKDRIQPTKIYQIEVDEELLSEYLKMKREGT